MERTWAPQRADGAAADYDPVRTAREDLVGKVINDKGQMLLVDGTLVETKRKTWMSAARQGDIDTLLMYIDEKKDVADKDGVVRGINFKEPNGYTALAIAATYNQLDVVKMLIEKGADINQPNNWKDTAMHRAAEAGYHEMVHLLLDHGADPMAEDWRGKRAIDYAKEELHREVMTVFRNHKQANPEKYKKTKFHQLPRAEQAEAVPELPWKIAEKNQLGVYATGGPTTAHF